MPRNRRFDDAGNKLTAGVNVSPAKGKKSVAQETTAFASGAKTVGDMEVAECLTPECPTPEGKGGC
ncbi:hypothetical protein ACP3TJ_05985 [Desulforudis sp. 1088]|uniref:hypothetical protein n=1 Tax=unclassified Candidatus Desulforudis TaxID=2635950 RepID=UPI003CE4655B